MKFPTRATVTGMDEQDLAQRRAAARRTAWILAAVAFGIFVLFFMTGVTGR